MDSLSAGVEALTEDRLPAVIRDARIVAIRWDIVPWSVVFDLDVPVSESKVAEMRRAWIVFEGVSMLNLSFANARLPIGISVISEMWFDEPGCCKGFREARFKALFTQTSPSDTSEVSKIEEMVVVSKRIFGAESVNSSPAGEFGLSWENRRLLASDDELREIALTAVG